MDATAITATIAGLVTLVGAVGAAAVAIIHAINEGASQRQAADTVKIEQANRILAQTPGATPVTLASPPSGTGDGSSKAVSTVLSSVSPPPAP